MVAETRAVLAAYGIEDASVVPVAIGLINRTFRVERGGSYEPLILQHVNPIFTPLVHADIDAVTRHVAAKAGAGVEMPRLVPAKSGALYVEHDGRVWRVMTCVEGVTHERLSDPGQAREAGALLGRFHRAVADLQHEFQNRRLGVHDTKKHLAVLADALVKHRGVHPRYEVVAPLGEQILEMARALPALPECADRVVHGDPKISNLMFDAASGRGRAIVDLDTLARMPLMLELGDAFRSWCNPLGEDQRKVEFSLALFEAAVRGYASSARGWIEPEEIRAIVPATRTIIVELAARFGADALNESYFGWDKAKYATRGEHNELRARGQVALAQSLAGVESEARELVERAFA